jgi:G3E family GTPase
MINTFIITGFLGAGKTTFLNFLLKQHASQSNIVIENEFGKANIDSLLIDEKIDQIVELTSGCICCTLNNELVDSLAKLNKLAKKPDNLFIETTGIADAGNIISILKSPLFEEKFKLINVICIADAETIEDRLVDTLEAGKQIAVSNLILINKTNLVNKDYLKKLVPLIKNVNPFAKVFESADGSVDFKQIETMNLYSDHHLPELTTTPVTEHKINTVMFKTTEKFDLKKLDYALTVNFMLYPHQLFRLKGFIASNQDQKIYCVQSAGSNITYNVASNNPNINKNESILIFIGRGLKTETINRILNPTLIIKEMA